MFTIVSVPSWGLRYLNGNDLTLTATATASFRPLSGSKVSELYIVSNINSYTTYSFGCF